jgi:3-phenylpropionate/cinnamic acid dioxygenase small subunit
MSAVTMGSATAAAVPAQLLRWFEIQQFYNEEAALLDERRYEDWLKLLDPQILYLMPIARNVRRDQLKNEYTTEGQTCWFDEGYETLAKRIAQIKTGMHWIEEPASRFSRIVSNVRLLDDGSDPDRCEAESRFVLYQNRLESEVAFFAGSRRDVLRRSEGQWRVARREIRLAQSTLLAKALALFF